jgi:ADP-heptose:LPS heptosyltransferase
MWPAENYISLILKLHKYNPSFQFVLIGGKKEMEICQKIKNTLDKNNLAIFNISGQMELSGNARVLAVADLYIGNETGNLHMALAVGASTVALVGGGHYNRFPTWKVGPKNVTVIHKMDCFNCDWNCIYEVKKGDPAPCIQGITVDSAYEQVIKVLSD